MKRQGQALVEFIIVLPVLIVIILGIIDFGLIFIKKNSLENNLEEVSEIWKKNQSMEEVNSYLDLLDDKILFFVTEKEEFEELILKVNYNPVTPGLNLVLGSPHEIKVSRVIYDE